jgi:ABC-type transport system substrate-binding protein
MENVTGTLGFFRAAVALLISCVVCLQPPLVCAQGNANQRNANSQRNANAGDGATTNAGAANAGAAQQNQPAEQPKSDDAPTEPKEEEQRELPTIDQMELPSMADLLKGPAITWVVLKNKKVIVCEPVIPRPNTIDAMNARIKASGRTGGQRSPDEPTDAEEARQWRRNLPYLQLTLLEGEEREYRLHMRFVQEIVHWEDMMLRRIDALLDERKIREAFELLNAFYQYIQMPDWPGAGQRQERIIFTQASEKFEQGALEEALALLEELHERNKTYPGLTAEMGVVVDRLITESDPDKDPRRVRFYLKRLSTREPAHPVVARWTKLVSEKGTGLLNQAVAAERKQQLDAAWDLIEQVQLLYPEAPNLTPIARRIGSRFQRLRVGVLQLPGEDVASWLTHGSAADRQRQLTSRQIFFLSHFEDKTVRYRSPFFEEWEPSELGHNVVFRLRTRPQPWDSQPASTATPLALTLAARIDPDHPDFDERLASYVDGVRMPSPFELQVHFVRVPPRTEALFNFSLNMAAQFDLDEPATTTASASTADTASTGSASPSGDESRTAAPGASSANEPAAGVPAATPGSRVSTGPTYPFAIHRSEPDRLIYRRTIPEPELANEYHVAEVIEQRYPNNDKAAQGLLRGDIAMLPTVRPWEVAKLESDGRFFVQPYAVPITHLLQFNPRSKPTGNRTLRRALVYSLNRKLVFEDVIVRAAADKSERLGRLTSAPFPTTSYAYATTVEPHKYDPALAMALSVGAKKELGGEIPTLKMICSADPVQRQAAQILVDQWKRVRLTVELIPPPAPNGLGSNPGGTDWDIAYRTVSLAEPLTELWSCLTLGAGSNAESLTLLPSWLRHELLTLDRAGDWDTAERLLKNLHRHLWAEVQVIPLWEVNEFLVYRKNIRGLSAQPMFTYQGVERWRVEP